MMNNYNMNTNMNRGGGERSEPRVGVGGGVQEVSSGEEQRWW